MPTLPSSFPRRELTVDPSATADAVPSVTAYLLSLGLPGPRARLAEDQVRREAPKEEV